MTRRVRVTAWIVLLGYAAFQAWAQRYAVGPDGISYLDLSDAVVSGHWARLVSLYWSPLYPALIGAARVLAGAGPAGEVPIVHALNVACFAATLGAFEYFIKPVLDIGRETPRALLAGPRGAVIAYAAFGFLLLTGSPLELTTPDLLASAAGFVAMGALLRVRPVARRPEAPLIRLGVILGAALGLGALAKAFLVPWGVVCFGLFILAAGRRAPKPLAAALVVWAAFVAPWSAVLSHRAGRLTFGDTGRLTYAWYVNMQDPPSTDLVPPGAIDRGVQATLPFVGITGPAPGTDPMWFDPSRWNAGVRPRLDVGQQIDSFQTSWGYYAQSYGILLFLIPLIALAGGPALRRAWDAGWPVYLAAAAGLFGYSAVLVTARYVIAYIAAAMLLALASLPIPRRLHPLYATFGLAVWVAIETVSRRDAGGLALITGAIAAATAGAWLPMRRVVPWLIGVFVAEGLVRALFTPRDIALLHIVAGLLVLLFWLGARVAIRRRRPVRYACGARWGVAAAVIGVVAFRFAVRARQDIAAARLAAAHGNVSLKIAQDLVAHGVGPGARIAVIGPHADSYWARTARLTIVGTVPEPMLPRYWALPDSARDAVLAHFAAAGAQFAIVTRPAPSGTLGARWVPLRYHGWLLRLPARAAPAGGNP